MKLGTTTLVATVRNEGPYLWEWVAYHKSIGFDKLPSADYIVIIWRLFGSSYKNIPNFDLTTTRFHRADPDGILSKNRPWGYKTMFRPKQFVRAGVHKPMPKNPNENFKIINASGLRSDKFVIDDWRSTDPKNRNLAQINHYIVRDAQSFVLKSARGRAHQIENQVHFSYWRKFNMNNDADTTLFHRENKLRKEMREIDAMTNGKVSALTNASVERHLEKFEDLMQVPEYADLYYQCIETNSPP